MTFPTPIPAFPPIPSGYIAIGGDGFVLPISSPILTIGEEGSVTYQQVNNSVGSSVFAITALYISAVDYAQFNENIGVVTIDSNGNETLRTLTLPIDPMQSSPSYVLDLKKSKIVVDGNTYFQITLIPQGFVLLQVYSYKLDYKDFLSGRDAFKDPEFMVQFSKFFEEYKQAIEE